VATPTAGSFAACSCASAARMSRARLMGQLGRELDWDVAGQRDLRQYSNFQAADPVRRAADRPSVRQRVLCNASRPAAKGGTRVASFAS